MLEALVVDAAEEGGSEMSETLPLEELVRKRLSAPPLYSASELVGWLARAGGRCAEGGGRERASEEAGSRKEGDVGPLEWELPARETVVDLEDSLARSSCKGGCAERDLASRVWTMVLLEATDFAGGREGRSAAML